MTVDVVTPFVDDAHSTTCVVAGGTHGIEVPARVPLARGPQICINVEKNKFDYNSSLILIGRRR